jgi:aspartyl protease family protein
VPKIFFVAFILAVLCAGPPTLTVRGSDGLFRSEIIVNETLVVRAVIDTGATSVGLCENMADRLGLPAGTPVEITTPGGVILGKRVRLASLRLGGILIRDVDAVVHPNAAWCDEVLLGLTALRRLTMVLGRHRLILVGTPTWWPRAH